MKTRFTILLMTSLLVLTLTGFSNAQVEWDVQRTFNLEKPALDVAVSLNGRWVYVLIDQGEIHIYSHEGTRKGKISVGNSADGIKPGPAEDVLFISNRENKTLQVIMLDFIRNINTKGSPFKGPADAPVVMAVFSDFQSPACAKLMPVLEQVLTNYPEQVKLVYKCFPQRGHGFARQAAGFALAADQQGKFWEFHDLLIENYKRLNKHKIQEIIEQLGLDAEKYRKDLRDPQIAARINEDMTEGAKARVKGIPAVFINGRMVRNLTLKGFEAIIEKELKKVKG